MPALHDLVVGFDRRVRAALASRLVTVPFGRLLLTDDLPLVYDQNTVWVDKTVEPQVLLETVEQVAASAHWGHRGIEVADAKVASRLRPKLLAAGYSEERHLSMVLARSPGSPERATAVVPIAQQLDLARALLAAEPWAGETVLDQFAQRDLRLAEVARGRAVVAPPAAPVSRCVVLSEGAIAEIDAVGTLARHRGAGWSTAVMRRAVHDALSEGVEHVVLVADEDDWPKLWYSRLGFREVGVLSHFRRWPVLRADHTGQPVTRAGDRPGTTPAGQRARRGG